MIPDGFRGAARRLSDLDIAAAAGTLSCDEAAIRAVLAVESRGNGYLPSGRPIILFEAHLFGRATGGRFDRSHPELSTQRWDRSLYAGGEREYIRLEAAMRLDRGRAMESASWGLFQILGRNHRAAREDDVEAFVAACCESEGLQLGHFVNFVRAANLAGHLRDGRWADFARGYNGPGYAANQYDVRLEQAFRRALGGAGTVAAGDLRAVQAALNAVASAGLVVDGVPGPATTAALRQFQVDAGLMVTGTADAATRAALGVS